MQKYKGSERTKVPRSVGVTLVNLAFRHNSSIAIKLKGANHSSFPYLATILFTGDNNAVGYKSQTETESYLPSSIM